MKVIGFLPLRAGSKGISHKNRKDFCGKPLYKWTLDAMIKAELFSEIWVSTDDEEIISNELHNTSVRIHKRSKAVSSDDASTEDVIMEFLLKSVYGENDIFLLAQATNPFINHVDYQQAISNFIKYSLCTEDFDISMLSVVENNRFIWNKKYNNNICPINYDPVTRKRRQDISCSDTYVENGAFYISYIKNIEKYHCRLTKDTLPYIMDQESYHEIDNPLDWKICEMIKKHLEDK